VTARAYAANSSTVGRETEDQSKAKTWPRAGDEPPGGRALSSSVTTRAVNDGRPLRLHHRMTLPKGGKRKLLAPKFIRSPSSRY
jgi:hypothetical protein